MVDGRARARLPQRTDGGGGGANTVVLNTAVGVFLVALALLVLSIYLFYELNALKRPPSAPGAALVYASLLALDAHGRLELAGAGANSGAGAGAGAGALDAALVLGARCRCCAHTVAVAVAVAAPGRDPTAPSGSVHPGDVAHGGAATACAVVDCLLGVDAITIAPAALNASAARGATACFALVAHVCAAHGAEAAAQFGDAAWMRRAANALARERHPQ